LIAAAVLCITAAAVFAANSAKRGINALKQSDMYGTYMFEDTVYMNPLSSFLPVKGYMPVYTFDKDSMIIIGTDGKETSVPAKYLRSEVAENEFKDSFDIDVGLPDISRYKVRVQYAINEVNFGNPSYSLYFMDGEIWLVTARNDKIWSIYKLDKQAAAVSAKEDG
jgi:hypothetical protein